MVSLTNIAVAALALFGLTHGHMIMKTPPPFGNPDNSPLSPNNFPCKFNPTAGASAAQFYAFDKPNEMMIGEPQTLSFTGSAVHGGGSCQLALTQDLQPSPATHWEVILSIEGSCPGVDGPSTFQYAIPSGIAPGKYVLSWSWLNKIGNRE